MTERPMTPAPPPLSPIRRHKQLERIWATAPGWGRLMDRLGQARVLLTAAGVWTGGLTLVIVSVVAAWPRRM